MPGSRQQNRRHRSVFARYAGNFDNGLAKGVDPALLESEAACPLRAGGAEATDRHRALAATAGASQVEAVLRR